MTHTQGAIGSIPVPPSAVSAAAWPRAGALPIWMAANCVRCDEAPACDARWDSSQACQKVAAESPKKRA